MKTTVIYHSADYDGLFCREIAKKFLPDDTVFIGWDFGQPLITLPHEGQIIVMDLPLDAPFGIKNTVEALGFAPSIRDRIVWIDHHKSAIENTPKNVPGYRIDGVSACRLAWHWCVNEEGRANPSLLASKQHFLDRLVEEPLAVRLAGEYDIWDHRADGDVEFQFGLDSERQLAWDHLLSDISTYTLRLVENGKAAMQCYAKRDADVMRERSFLTEFEGMKFLCLNTPRCNSNTFSFKDHTATGHDALMAFFWNGTMWSVSLYHAAHNTGIDLSQIARKHGGGGHRGACGFRVSKLPFIP